MSYLSVTDTLSMSSNFVIDTALNVMRKTYCEFKNKIRILSCSVSSHLNNDPSKKIFNLETTVVPKESLLIMPLHVKGNHWVIMFVDFGNRKFYYLEPFQTTEYNKCRHNFVTILSELKKKSCVWRGRQCVARDEFSKIF